MPSQVRTVLNQLIRADLTAAEINSAGQRGFAACAWPKLGGQGINLRAVIWSVSAVAADRPNGRATLTLQRGLIVRNDTTFPGAFEPNQMIFEYEAELSLTASGPWFPSTPYKLEPGDSYALILSIFPTAAFANAATLRLSAMGEAVSMRQDEDQNI